jgi:hypothetical protein
MTGLPRPDLPSGHHRELNDALHDLHHRAGWPSLRTLANAAGCSHTTVSTAFSSPRLPNWGLVELLVEAMDGDTAQFHQLWVAASSPATDQTAAAPRIAGRRAELAVVRRHLESGTGLLLVTGEAGIGKTRLLQAAAQLVGDQCFVATGCCLPLATQVPLLPVADLLRSVHDHDSGAWLREALDRCPGYVALSLAILVPELGGEAAPAGLDDSWSRQRLHNAIAATLASLADLEPLALVIDDLHWADSATLDLVEHLVTRGLSVPMVGSYRVEDPAVPEATTDWFTRIGRQTTDVVELTPLQPDESREQLALLLGREPDPDLVARIHARAAGHPLFTEQLAADQADGRVMPQLLADLLDRRVGRLEGPAREAAAALAVADRPVTEPALATMTGLAAAEVVTAVHTLRDRRLLRDTLDSDLVELRHPLLAEAIRQSLTSTETTQQHRRIAETLALEPDAPAAQVAEHWLRGGDQARALDWTMRAAQLADARFARAEAAELWQRALTWWPAGTNEAGDPPLRHAEAYVAAVDACRRAGDSERALALAGEALAGRVALTPMDTAELLRMSAVNLPLGRDERTARIDLLDRSITIYRSLAPCEGLVQALDSRAGLHNRDGEYAAAVEVLRQASQVAQELGDAPPVRLAARLAWQEAFVGDVERGLTRFTDLAAQQPSTPDPERDLSVAVSHTDALLMAARPAPEVAAAAALSLAEADAYGTRGVHRSVVLYNVAIAWCRAGDVSRAEAVLGPALEPGNNADERLLRQARATVDLLLGRLSESAATLESLTSLQWTRNDEELATSVLLTDLWRGDATAATDTLLDGLETGLLVLTPGSKGIVLTTLARAVADESQRNPARRRELQQRLSALPAPGADPVGATVVPVDRAAEPQWIAELGRLEGTATVEDWTRAAVAWDRISRPHDAAYCRWRGAQVALAHGQGTIAARLLKRAARDARQHVPLASAIAQTAAHAAPA